MRVLVVSTAELGVKHVVHDVLSALVDGGGATDDVESATEPTDAGTFHYLTRPSIPVPDGVTATRLGSARVAELVGDVEPAYLAYAILGFWLRAYRALGRVHDDFDAVWLHNPRLLSLLPEPVADRCLVTYHNHLRGAKAEYHDGLARLYYRLFGAMERRALRAHDGLRYTGVARDVVTELRAAGVPTDRVRYVGNGVDVDRFTPAAGADAELAGLFAHPGSDGREPVSETDGGREAGGDGTDADDTVRLLSLGSLTPQKRPLALLRFFDALCERTHRDLALVVAGEGPRRGAAERFAREHDLQNVTFPGFVDEARKPALYAAADWFVMASRYEGEPLALYEALAAGTPALVSDLPVHRFVGEAGCGQVLGFDAPAAAAESAAADVDRPQTEFAMNARTYATENLSWASRATEYRAELERVSRPC